MYVYKHGSQMAYGLPVGRFYCLSYFLGCPLFTASVESRSFDTVTRSCYCCRLNDRIHPSISANYKNSGKNSIEFVAALCHVALSISKYNLNDATDSRQFSST